MIPLSNDEEVAKEIQIAISFFVRNKTPRMTLEVLEVQALLRCIQSFKVLYESELNKNNDRVGTQP